MNLGTPSSANERMREQLANDVDNARVGAAAAAIHVKNKADDARDAGSSNWQELRNKWHAHVGEGTHGSTSTRTRLTLRERRWMPT